MSGSGWLRRFWIAVAAMVAMVLVVTAWIIFTLLDAASDLDQSSDEAQVLSSATTAAPPAPSTDTEPDGVETSGSELTSGERRFDSCGDYFVEDIGFGDLRAMLSGGRFGPPTELLLTNDDELVTVTGAQPLHERQLFVRPDILVEGPCEVEVVLVELTVTSAIRTN